MSSPPVPPSRFVRVTGLLVRKGGLLAAAAIVAVVAVISVAAFNRADRALHARDVAKDQKAQAQATATKQAKAGQALATDVNTLCAELKRLHRPCPVQSPDKTIKQVTGQTPIPGPTGPSGTPGRGIVQTQIDSTGELLISYSDGSTVAVGNVRGVQGPSGSPGAEGHSGIPGRGIRSTTLSGTSLVITYTDGTRLNVGTVVGPAGRGVAGSAIDGDGNLVVAYTDGTSQVLGHVVGSNGTDGKDCDPVATPACQGPAGRGIDSTTYDDDTGMLTITYTDGTSKSFHVKGDTGPAGPSGSPGGIAATYDQVNPDGTTQTCTRDPDSPDSHPTYHCVVDAPTGSGLPTAPVPTP